MTDYRTRIYSRYASVFKDEGKSFDAAAADRVARAYRRYFDRWLPADRAARVVDVACGNGRMLHMFKQWGYTDIHGVDLSGEQVALARQVAPDVVEGDVLEYLKARPGHFDLITGIDIIEHLHKNDVLDFLDACHAALRTGGRLVLQTPNGESPWCTRIRYGDFTHEVCFTPDSLGRLMRLCGFDGIDARELGPLPNSLKGLIRFAVWKVIRAGCFVWNLAETASPGSGVFTRVLLISGLKR